jgi:hypothetical protein
MSLYTPPNHLRLHHPSKVFPKFCAREPLTYPSAMSRSAARSPCLCPDPDPAGIPRANQVQIARKPAISLICGGNFGGAWIRGAARTPGGRSGRGRLTKSRRTRISLAVNSQQVGRGTEISGRRTMDTPQKHWPPAARKRAGATLLIPRTSMRAVRRRYRRGKRRFAAWIYIIFLRFHLSPSSCRLDFRPPLYC